MAKNMSGIDTSGMSSFGKALTKLGNSGVDGFISAFNGAIPRMSQAANNVINGMLTAFQGRTYEFNTAGQTIIDQFVAGVQVKESVVKGIFTTIITVGLNTMRDKRSEFNQVGQVLMVEFITSIESKSPRLTNILDGSIESMLSSINGYRGSFESAGKNLVEGFAQGISANSYLAESKAAAMAKGSYNSAMKAMNAHSPSRLFMQAGSYVPAGFAKGIESVEGDVTDSAKSMAERALDATKLAIAMISEVINSDLDAQPTIRPVLDLSEVQAGTSRLNTLFSQRQVASIGGIMNNPVRKDVQNGDPETGSSGSTFTFTQNNYSPKALSRADIYRQTKNQFSAMKGMVTKR
jgi:hypothetical protein